MILPDIYNFLKNDAALSALLSADTESSKIYPNFAPAHEQAPYIVYRSGNPGAGDEILNAEIISFEITADKFSQIIDISERLTDILDMPEREAITSEKYCIFFGKKIGGQDFSDGLRKHIRVMTFVFKFKALQ